MAINRYFYLNNSNGTQANMPLVKISKRTTDKFVLYDSNLTRLDRISYSTYNDDTFGWLILLANPQYFMEFDIPKGQQIRVPFPLQDAITEFQNKLLVNKNK